MNLFKNLISVISNSFKEKKEQLFFKENETFFNDFKNYAEQAITSAKNLVKPLTEENGRGSQRR